VFSKDSIIKMMHMTRAVYKSLHSTTHWKLE